MKRNRIIIFLFVLLSLLGVIWLQKLAADRAGEENAARVELTPGISADQVNKIMIVKPDATITFTRSADIWNIAEASTSAQASGARINDLLGILDGVPVELVSQNPERQVELGITDELAYKVLFFNNDQELYALLVSATNDQLVRQKGKENVYQWGSNLSRLITTGKDSWLEPTPMPTEPATVTPQP